MIIHVHYKNHKAYQVIRDEDFMIQVDDEWVPAVLYVSMDEPNKYFARTKAEFDEKFTRVAVPVKHQPQGYVR